MEAVQYRVNLSTLPDHMKNLPMDPRGLPIPWFVGTTDQGVRDFRLMDPAKWRQAVKQRLCWVCGQPLGRWLAFPIGPMCAITRTTQEPASHRDCAEWSIQNCPFLSNPQMVRNTENLPKGYEDAAGLPIMRNPGVMCLWLTREFETFDDGRGGKLITVGRPENVFWWREGRPATRAEVQESIDSGIGNLLELAKSEGRFAVESLGKQVDRVQALLPLE